MSKINVRLAHPQQEDKILKEHEFTLTPDSKLPIREIERYFGIKNVFWVDAEELLEVNADGSSVLAFNFCKHVTVQGSLDSNGEGGGTSTPAAAAPAAAGPEFCHSCGTKTTAPDARFCISCGQKF